MIPEYARSANFCDYQVTVEAIEHKRSQSDAVVCLPEAVASEVKTIKGSLAQKLGCR